MANQDPGASGSQIMYPAVPASPESGHALVPMQPMAQPPGMMGMGGPRGPEVLTGPFNQTWLINCLRRRWLLALCMGPLDRRCDRRVPVVAVP